MTTPTYAAIIQISLPELPETVTANVVLTAADAIPQDGRFKPLADCTLADLQQFADQLEAEVWETVGAIRLLDLANHADADVSLTVHDAEGERVAPSRDWFQKAVLVVETTPAAAAEAPVEEASVEEASVEEASAEETSIEVDPADEESAAEAEEPAPLVAETADTLLLTEETPPPAALESDDEETVEPETAAEPDESEAVMEPAAEPDVDVETAVIVKPIPPEPEPEPDIKVAEPEPVFAEPEYDTMQPRIEPSRARVRVAGRRLPPGSKTWAAVDILLDEPALRAAQAHALSSMDREVAGVLVGPRPEKQPDGRYVVHVIDTIEAKYTVMQGASVTYTPESWRYMNDALWEKYPDETAVIVGWYHTHPGFGIFLSGMDQFIHQNFFTQIWHIAYVLDPRARTSGFFCWNRRQNSVNPLDFSWPAWAARSW